jgi:hypothetical protein
MSVIAIYIIVSASAMVAYGAVKIYVRRSMNSFQMAEFVWGKLAAEAQAIIEADVPASVGKVVLALAATAGCGRYVRGLLIAHYLPTFVIARGDRQGRWSGSLEAVENLPPEIRDRFEHMMALVMIYDGYRNPVHGWFFRRVMKSYTESKRTFEQKLETKLTAVSVLSRKEPLDHLEHLRKSLIPA